MLTTAQKIRLAAAAVAALAATCLPWPVANPKPALNTFSWFAHGGHLMPLFIGTMALAALLFAVSFLFRR